MNSSVNSMDNNLTFLLVNGSKVFFIEAKDIHEAEKIMDLGLEGKIESLNLNPDDDCFLKQINSITFRPNLKVKIT